MKTLKLFMLIFATAAVLSTGLYADDDKDVALMLKTVGQVELNKQGKKSWISARRGARIHSGEQVRTGDKSLAALIFTDDKSQLKIRSNSNVTINGKREKKSIIKKLTLGFGELWAKITNQETSMRVETPSGVATVKGTEFNALFDNENFIVFVRQGLVEIFNQFGSMLLRANEMGRIRRGSPPERLQGNPDEIFDLSGEDESLKLEIEYEDPEGNKKKLIIDF
ncbi:FecR domain-containing protein [candidate division KSB1 bacterium]|nr:FecR domain-containing protein [candidate division KSB1 bacterium]NIR69564.1 FecR domain-containing protein [candidate division KSB1 bacterium]NIS25912.1 FecR domain-containing protein [candidate division KSB1 bacterium]NIT72793.1 FecR domain-containing protein [candidate division KSB1 bacterium]NIU26600.1 FecR domain-containing protein [candidate division KSB1 bacterium]